MSLRDITEVQDDELGPLAKCIRKKLGLTAQAVARDMGVTRSALSRAEGGDPKLYSLALRAVNHLAEQAAEQGKMESGHIVTSHLAVGGIVDELGVIRAPERTRFAGMLRMALMPFGLTLDIEQELGTAVIDLGTGGEESIRVDLDDTRLYFFDGHRSHSMGWILRPKMFAGERDEECEAARLYAFAVALNDADLGVGVDVALAMRTLKGFADLRSPLFRKLSG